MALMNPEIKARWLAALRSGEYEQGRGKLRNGDAFCCLGVLCEIASKYKLGKWRGNDAFDDGMVSVSNVPPRSITDWAGLDEPNPLVGDYRLADYNDGQIPDDLRPHTFTEIANLIERHL